MSHSQPVESPGDWISAWWLKEENHQLWDGLRRGVETTRLGSGVRRSGRGPLEALGATRRADGAVSSNRVEGTFNLLLCGGCRSLSLGRGCPRVARR